MKNYADHRMHYRMLISKINEEVNFSGFLILHGYTLLKRSTGSQEYSKGTERIVLNVGRKPVSYFNRNDTADKGWFFTFLLRRSVHFYDAINQGLEAIQSTHLNQEIHSNKTKKKAVKAENAPLLIEPLYKADYLLKDRGLSLSTLNSEAFKGKIYNGIYATSQGGRIANIALPLTDVQGNIKNYILTNRPYWNPKVNRYEKFRRVINEEYAYLFSSNRITDYSCIACYESAFDAMAHHEFNGFPENFYLAFGGQLDLKKMEQFFLWQKELDPKGELPIHLGFDLDTAGLYYDLFFIKALMDREKKNHQSSLHRKDFIVRLEISGSVIGELPELLQVKFLQLQGKMAHPPVEIIALKDCTIVEIDLEKVQQQGFGPTGAVAYWKKAISLLTEVLLSQKIIIDKPSFCKDWNDELMLLKTHEQVPVQDLQLDNAKESTRIIPKTKSGSTEAVLGKIMRVNREKVLCDFGEKEYRWVRFDNIAYVFRAKESSAKEAAYIKSIGHGRKS